MIAGGASGIVGMSGELGADDRLVAFMQYLRVLVVVLLTPVGIAVLFGSPHEAGGGHLPSTGTFGDPLDWLLTAALAAAGALLGRRARITAGVLLVPMLLTGVLVLTGVLDDFAVPALLNQTAFSLIGLRVGLSFTVGTVQLLGRLTAPGAGDDRVPAGGELRPGGRARRHHAGDAARRLPRDHARRPLRGAGGRVRRGRQHDLHRRGPDPARDRDGAARAAGGAAHAE